MSKWSFFKTSSRRDHLWVKFKSDFLPISDMETLHQIYVCDLKLEEQVSALSKLENFFEIENDFADTFRKFFSFIESKLTFEEFTFYLWNTCTLHEKDLAFFLFGLHAAKGSETICRDHFIELLKALLRNNNESNFDYGTLPHMQYSAKTFAHFCKGNKEFLSSAVSIQDKLRGKCLGKSFWVKQMKKRYLKRKTKKLHAVTLPEMFNYYYKLRLKSIPLDTLASHFYSSQNCDSVLGAEEIAAFKENPYTCFLSIHCNLNMCPKCIHTHDTEEPERRKRLDIEFHKQFEVEFTSKLNNSESSSYRNQIQLILSGDKQKPRPADSNFLKHRLSVANIRALSNPLKRSNSSNIFCDIISEDVEGYASHSLKEEKIGCVKSKNQARLPVSGPVWRKKSHFKPII